MKKLRNYIIRRDDGCVSGGEKSRKVLQVHHIDQIGKIIVRKTLSACVYGVIVQCILLMLQIWCFGQLM